MITVTVDPAVKAKAKELAVKSKDNTVAAAKYIGTGTLSLLDKARAKIHSATAPKPNHEVDIPY